MSTAKIPPLCENVRKAAEVLNSLSNSKRSDFATQINVHLHTFLTSYHETRMHYVIQKARAKIGSDENELSHTEHREPLDVDTRKIMLSLQKECYTAAIFLEKAGYPLSVQSSPSPKTATASVATDVEGLLSVAVASTSTDPVSRDRDVREYSSKKVRPRVQAPSPSKKSTTHKSTAKSCDTGSIYDFVKTGRRNSRWDVIDKPKMIPIPVTPPLEQSPAPADAPPKPIMKSVGTTTSIKTHNTYTSTPSEWPIKKTLKHVGTDPMGSSRRSDKKTNPSTSKPAAPKEKAFRTADGKIIHPPSGSVTWAAPPKNTTIREAPEVKKRSRDDAALALCQLDGHATSHGIIRAYFLDGILDVGQQTDDTTPATAEFSSQAGSSTFEMKEANTQVDKPMFDLSSESEISRKRRVETDVATTAKRIRTSVSSITETEGAVSIEDLKPAITDAVTSMEELLPQIEATPISAVPTKFAMPNLDMLTVSRPTEADKQHSLPSVTPSPVLKDVASEFSAESSVPVAAEPEPEASTETLSEAEPSVPVVKMEVEEEDVIITGTVKAKKDKHRKKHHRSKSSEPEKEKESIEDMVKRILLEQQASQQQQQQRIVYVGVPVASTVPVAETVATVPLGLPQTMQGIVPTPTMIPFSQANVSHPVQIPVSSQQMVSPGNGFQPPPAQVLQSPAMQQMPPFGQMTSQQFHMIQQLQQQQFSMTQTSTMSPQQLQQQQAQQLRLHRQQNMPQQQHLNLQQIQQLQQQQRQQQLQGQNRLPQAQQPINTAHTRPEGSVQPTFQTNQLQQQQQQQRRHRSVNSSNPTQSQQQQPRQLHPLQPRPSPTQAPMPQQAQNHPLQPRPNPTQTAQTQTQQQALQSLQEFLGNQPVSRPQPPTSVPSTVASTDPRPTPTVDPVVSNMQQFINEQMLLNQQQR